MDIFLKLSPLQLIHNRSVSLPTGGKCLCFLDMEWGYRRTLGFGRSCPRILAGFIHTLMHSLILASTSEIRAQLLRNAGLSFEIRPARIDEEMIRQSLQPEAASPRDVADALAEMKAQKVSLKAPEAMVLGADQVLALKGEIFSKPESPEEAEDQLKRLSGQIHRLLSALVVYQDGKPLWRHIGEVRLHMHPLSEAFIAEYVARNWESIRWSVGGYKLEEEGVRLFSKVEGDYFSVLGLPLIEFLSWLRARGDLTT